MPHRTDRPPRHRKASRCALAGGVLIIGLCFVGGCSTVAPPRTPLEAVEQVTRPAAVTAKRAVQAIEPSNQRNWEPNLAVLPFAEFHGDRVTVCNIRNTTYRTADDYTARYYDKTFDLRKIRTLDLFVEPFASTPVLAHVAMSFGFEGDQHLGVSVEIRKEQGEGYDPIRGLCRQYELMYVVADERDMVRLSADVLKDDLYLYRLRLSPKEVRVVFVDVLNRVNRLIEQPEFYHTLTNNCTTNVVRHLNTALGPGRELPYNHRVVFPGLIDKLLYDRGLIATDTTFPRTRLAAHVNARVYRHAAATDFSTAIRRR